MSYNQPKKKKPGGLRMFGCQARACRGPAYRCAMRNWSIKRSGMSAPPSPAAAPAGSGAWGAVRGARLPSAARVGDQLKRATHRALDQQRDAAHACVRLQTPQCRP